MSIHPNPIDVYDYFSHPRPFANLKIILNNQTIWCDKASLAAASPVLREQLSKNLQDDSLVLQEIDLHEFLAMLEFIYPIFHLEINERNISSLIKLASRFQFDMLEHACQIYVMKYLSTIRRVWNYYHQPEAEGDYCLANNEHDLIQFHNRTCVDALKIIINLSRWLKTYYRNEQRLVIQAIISVLQQISVDYLEQAITIVEISDDLKSYIYQERAKYLEEVCNHLT